MEHADDLVLLAADKQMAETLRGILSRPQALAIRALSFAVYHHPHKDPGCRREAHKFLRPLHTDFRRALVLFDYVGCGVSSETSPAEVEAEVEEKLGSSGWGERARCVVIDPELEVWVWSDSPEVGRCLGWEGARARQVQDWLRSTDRWPDDSPKPPAPKEAVEEALQEVRQPRSSALFRELAESVSLSGCEDESFQRFRAVLQEWFPPSWQQ
jgi:hypothetical protein